jgi:hypothetical protein
MALAMATGAVGIVQITAPQSATAVTKVAASAPASARAAHTPTVPARTARTQAARTQTEPAAPSSYTLTIEKQYQRTTYYCLPASAAMSLSTFGIKVGQATLAGKMSTTTAGTSGDDALPVLRSYVRSRGYKYQAVADVAGHPKVLMRRVAYDVGVLHRAPAVGVWMERLPWNRGEVEGTRIGHIMAVYGYDRTKGTITVFDPWKPTGGTHTLSAKTLAGTLQTFGGMHYISKL